MWVWAGIRGIDLGLYFGGWGGWGWGGWGWAPNWYGGNIYMNNSFFHRYGFRNFNGGGRLGSSTWMHNPDHRLGCRMPIARWPAGLREMALRAPARFGGGRGQSFNRGTAPSSASEIQGFEQRGWTGNHSVFGGYHNGGMARMQSDRGFSSMGAGRTFGGGGMRGGGFGGGGGGMRGGGGGGGMRGGGGRR